MFLHWCLCLLIYLGSVRSQTLALFSTFCVCCSGGGSAGSTYWEPGQNRPNGPPNNWSAKPSNSWSNDNTGGNWVGQSPSNSGGGGWGDGPNPNNHWQAGVGNGRKPSYSWEESQANGGAGDYNRDRPGRSMVSSIVNRNYYSGCQYLTAVSVCQSKMSEANVSYIHQNK